MAGFVWGGVGWGEVATRITYGAEFFGPAGPTWVARCLASQTELLHGQKLQGTLTSNEVQAILLKRNWEAEYPLFTTVRRFLKKQMVVCCAPPGLALSTPGPFHPWPPPPPGCSLTLTLTRWAPSLLVAAWGKQVPPWPPDRGPLRWCWPRGEFTPEATRTPRHCGGPAQPAPGVVPPWSGPQGTSLAPRCRLLLMCDCVPPTALPLPSFFLPQVNRIVTGFLPPDTVVDYRRAALIPHHPAGDASLDDLTRLPSVAIP